MSSRKYEYSHGPKGALGDKELLTRCVELAGTKRNLARILGVSPQTVSGWGSRHPIPRHVRPRLEEYVGLRRIDRAEPVGRGEKLLAGHQKLLDQIREILRPEIPGDVGKLPPRYRARYRQRVKEIESRINEEGRLKLSELLGDMKRELEDFRARLMAEYRARRKSSI
jgi:hypothetical protein